MGELKVSDKEIVVPGQVLATGMDYLPSGDVFRDNDKLIASKVGLINVSGRVIKLIPLKGIYSPKRDDIVIGKVVDTTLHGWRVDIGLAYEGNISLRDGSSEYIETSELSRYYAVGDYVVAQITKVIGAKIVDLTMKNPGLRKLGPGRLIRVTSVKVPRIVGKQGSMISMIKDATDCKISVGQNGIVWISGLEPKNEEKAVKAIELIERESHTSGLTERVKEFLEKNK